MLEFFREKPEEAKKQFGDDPFEIHNVLKYWVRGNKDNDEMHIIPTDTLYLNIDKEAVKRSGMMLPKDSLGNVNIPDRMAISLTGKRALYKGDLMLLEMVANSNWTRPLYVALTVGAENYMNLGENFIQEGLVNRITPFHTNESNNFDTDKIYKNLMTRFKFGGLEKPGLYLDETVTRMCYTHRRMFAQLIKHLLDEGDNERAAKAIAYAEKVLPTYNLPYNYLGGGIDFAEAYYRLGDAKKAEAVVSSMFKTCSQYVAYYLTLKQSAFNASIRDCMYNLFIMQSLIEVVDQYNKEYGDKLAAPLSKYMQLYQQRGGTLYE